MTEATTRTLRTPVEYGPPPTDFLPPQPTSPAYLAPTETPPSPAYNTTNLEKSGRKPNAWLVGFVITLVLLAVLALGLVTLIKNRTPTSQPPGAIPEPPAVTAPGVPPPPPAPPPGTTTGANTISREFIYPGAETVMELKRPDGNMIQLRTTDSYEKVLAWYEAKLNPLTTQKLPGSSSILRTKQLMVLINHAGGETSVMLKQLDKDDFDIDLDR